MLLKTIDTSDTYPFNNLGAICACSIVFLDKSCVNSSSILVKTSAAKGKEALTCCSRLCEQRRFIPAASLSLEENDFSFPGIAVERTHLLFSPSPRQREVACFTLLMSAGMRSRLANIRNRSTECLWCLLSFALEFRATIITTNWVPERKESISD
ncbi:hypothetical protein CDAR_306611 [Caerostris darwini]|uniref:Uncharacterized protein n=1 Tax=Caerostris darwini TaxID=1538125 RepID=A0AAV4SCX9_9ARAC|nr:hypothetical protein CDAR_306611 [Caerostris darwini]